LRTDGHLELPVMAEAPDLEHIQLPQAAGLEASVCRPVTLDKSPT
jgi:hypothetical protein